MTEKRTPQKRHDFTCYQCGKRYIAHRMTSRFCSATCRAQSHKQKDRTTELLLNALEAISQANLQFVKHPEERERAHNLIVQKILDSAATLEKNATRPQPAATAGVTTLVCRYCGQMSFDDKAGKARKCGYCQKTSAPVSLDTYKVSSIANGNRANHMPAAPIATAEAATAAAPTRNVIGLKTVTAKESIKYFPEYQFLHVKNDPNGFEVIDVKTDTKQGTSVKIVVFTVLKTDSNTAEDVALEYGEIVQIST